MKKILAMFGVAALAGCFPASVNGAVSGKSMAVSDGRAFISSGDFAGLAVILAEIPLHDVKEGRPGDLENKSQLSLFVGPLGSGEFTVFDPESPPAEVPEKIGSASFFTFTNVSCDGDDFSGDGEPVNADGGTVTIEAEPKVGEEARGTFELTFGDDTLSGSFAIKGESDDALDDEEEVKCVE